MSDAYDIVLELVAEHAWNGDASTRGRERSRQDGDALAAERCRLTARPVTLRA